MTTFVRLLDVDVDQKGAKLAAAAQHCRAGEEAEGVFQVTPASFEQVPGSPFAYWVSESVRQLFAVLPTFEGNGRTARVGLQTSDDHRFVRLWWEPDPVGLGTKWFAFSKGGATSPFYQEIFPVVNWERDGAELWSFYHANRSRTGGMIKNPTYYFQPGLTWPLRAARFSPVPLPEKSIFSVRGYAAFTPVSELLLTLGLFATTPFDLLFKLTLGRFGFPEFVVGQLRGLPWPSVDPNASARLSSGALRCWSLRRSDSQSAQSARSFTLPALLRVAGSSLTDRGDAWATRLLGTEAEVRGIQRELDDVAFGLYGIGGQDRRRMEEGFSSVGSIENATDDEGEEDTDEEAESADLVGLTESLLEWTMGVALGRFDVRLATGERAQPPQPKPFDALPSCSPGMLQAANGLPAHEPPTAYPVDLPPHGVLVDDPGHPWDVVKRIEATFGLIARTHAQAWLQEAEGLLARDLRGWLRRYGFERHLKRYSRSRRRAPLFWHLAPKSGEYGIWLYSPVATRDTFYRILNDYVEPKLKAAERRLLELRQHVGGGPRGQQRKELAAQESLVEDLRAFREQVALVAPLWKPYRDDGVVLNCALLSRLFDHHHAWQKECAKRWEELAGGKYDWAGWAMHLWPERVVPACASDRSIAIAHGLEEALWEEDEDGNWVPRSDADEQIAELVAERSSPAIKAALDAYERAG